MTGRCGQNVGTRHTKPPDGGTRFESDVLDPAFSDFYGPAQREEAAPNEQFIEDSLLRTVEIIDKYSGPGSCCSRPGARRVCRRQARLTQADCTIAWATLRGARGAGLSPVLSPGLELQSGGRAPGSFRRG